LSCPDARPASGCDVALIHNNKIPNSTDNSAIFESSATGLIGFDLNLQNLFLSGLCARYSSKPGTPQHAFA
jgi:hypothetical protein